MTPSPSDEDLLVSAIGNPEAFGQLYDRHVKEILRYFERRTASTHTSADLTAETFAEALRSLRRYNPEKGDAKGWLYGIARHQLSHFLRHQKVSNKSLKKLGVHWSGVDHNGEESMRRVESRVDAVIELRLIENAIKSLPNSLSDAVMLRVGHGLDFDEVAERLGCSPGAARVRVSRGLSRLADAVNE